MRIHVRSLIDFTLCIVELVEIAVAPKSTTRRWINQSQGRASTNRLQY